MTRIRNFYILLGWLCLLVCGCTPHEPRFVVGVSQCSNDKWREQMNKEIKREALFYPEVQVEIRSANDNNQTQIEDIRSFIAQGGFADCITERIGGNHACGGRGF